MSTDDDPTGRGRLWDLIHDIRFGMFVTRQEDGSMHSHPMTLQNRTLDEPVLSFFMSRRGEPFVEQSRDARVSVAFADAGRDRYVSISGTAAERNDAERRRQLWNTMVQAWFPGGPDDPDVALVEVRISRAHYWDVKQNQAVQLFKMAKAAVTGQPPKDMGTSKEVSMP